MLILVNTNLILVLSDPKKKAYYDKYGKVEEDDFNFEDFMKHFSEMFNDDFLKGGLFEQMMAPGMESRHGYKLMYIRKRAENKKDETKETNQTKDGDVY
jgi:DnaJ-class molecular chaperone